MIRSDAGTRPQPPIGCCSLTVQHTTSRPRVYPLGRAFTSETPKNPRMSRGFARTSDVLEFRGDRLAANARVRPRHEERRLTGFAGEAQGPTPVGPAAVDIASGTHFRPCLPTDYPVLKAG